MIKIWGRPNSGCTQRVMWTLDEAGIEFQLVLASSVIGPDGHVSTGAKPYGVVDTPLYRAMNPNGNVPTMKSDDLVLWESMAIVSHIALTYAPRLFGDDIAMHSLGVQWGAWANANFDPLLHVFVSHLVRYAENLRDPALVETSRQVMISKLEMLETQLTKGSYLAGDVFTIADILVAPAVHRWLLFNLEAPAMPKLLDWHSRLVERPAFAKYVAPAKYHLA